MIENDNTAGSWSSLSSFHKRELVQSVLQLGKKLSRPADGRNPETQATRYCMANNKIFWGDRLHFGHSVLNGDIAIFSTGCKAAFFINLTVNSLAKDLFQLISAGGEVLIPGNIIRWNQVPLQHELLQTLIR
jgi:hypothetical protein